MPKVSKGLYINSQRWALRSTAWIHICLLPCPQARFMSCIHPFHRSCACNWSSCRTPSVNTCGQLTPAARWQESSQHTCLHSTPAYTSHLDSHTHTHTHVDITKMSARTCVHSDTHASVDTHMHTHTRTPKLYLFCILSHFLSSFPFKLSVK